MDGNDFFDWLQKKHRLTPKSARDVVSRVRRAKQYVDLTMDIGDEELVFKLSQNTNFQDLTLTVKSQLRRAVRLLKEFQSSKGN